MLTPSVEPIEPEKCRRPTCEGAVVYKELKYVERQRVLFNCIGVLKTVRFQRGDAWAQKQ